MHTYKAHLDFLDSLFACYIFTPILTRLFIYLLYFKGGHVGLDFVLIPALYSMHCIIYIMQ